MNKSSHRYDVAIIGAGPSGIAAALALKNNGINNIVVLERESQAGGIPRHCGHPPFGLREYKRVLTGPVYAAKLVESAQQAKIDIQLKSNVISLGDTGELVVLSPQGKYMLQAKRVLIATGTRETPRSARKVTGDRAMGICNTGALQSMVYLKQLIPFRCPVIIGSELVSFSALMTCKKAGIKPIMMLEEKAHPRVAWPLHYSAYLFSVPLKLNHKLVNIIGDKRVSAVRVLDNKGKTQEISCDGVLFTGQFTPESTLARMAGLLLDKQGAPVTDSSGRCSNANYYAVGNLLHDPVKRADQCWRKGQLVGEAIAKDLRD